MFDELRSDLQKLLDDGISRETAIDFVISAVEKEKTQRKKVIAEAVDIAASRTVSRALSQHRRTICQRAEKISQAREEGSKKLKVKVAGFMGFRLHNGIALADATGPDCLTSANIYMVSAKSQYHRAAFLHDIADRVGDSKVGSVLNESDLQDAYEKARSLP